MPATDTPHTSTISSGMQHSGRPVAHNDRCLEQLSLSCCPDDRDYFSFITEWGRYRYKSVPQGWIASGDAYTHRYDNITMNIQNHKKIVDDSILWSPNLRQAFMDARKFLTQVGQNSVVLNKSKLKFAHEQ